MIDRLTPERVWLYLYRCHVDFTVDVELAAREADRSYAEYMKRFGSEDKWPRWYRGLYEKFRLSRLSGFQ